MKVIGISGSPRRKGNTEILLDKVLEGALSYGAHTEKIILNELDFRPCQECGSCRKDGSCPIKDDMVLVRKKIEEADCIVVSSPVFFCNVSAQLKSMIDRFQSFWVRKYILKKHLAPRKKKTGAFLCVSGEKKGIFFECTEKVVRAFFMTLGVEYSGGIFCGGIELKGEMKKNKDVLDKAFKLGVGMVRDSGA